MQKTMFFIKYLFRPVFGRFVQKRRPYGRQFFRPITLFFRPVLSYFTEISAGWKQFYRSMQSEFESIQFHTKKQRAVVKMANGKVVRIVRFWFAISAASSKFILLKK
jgi:hypothetical protein